MLFNDELGSPIFFRCGCRDDEKIEKEIVTKLKLMLDENNGHAKAFRMARDVMKENTFQDLKLKLISNRTSNGCVYNMPIVSKVSALIAGDIDSAE